MANQLFDTGEEFYQDAVATELSGTGLTVGLYNDSTDSLTDAEDVGDITTEPGDGNYARQNDEPFGTSKASGDWTLTNDNQISFDVTDTTGSVDSYFIVVNFTSDDKGDSGATDHLLATGALSQSYDLSNLDTLNLAAGGVGTSLD